MQSLQNEGFPLDLGVNVDIKVTNANGKLLQRVTQHNKATSEMTSGIVRFLRGEFNNTLLDINTIGSHADQAKYYIPSFISFGNVGTDRGKSLPVYDSNDNSQYSDSALLSEIFKYSEINNQHENHRLPILRSTYGSSKLSNAESLMLSTTVNFMGDNFSFYYSNGDQVDYLTGTEDNPKYAISEIGLFSGDTTDYNSKLLARLLLDSTTPLVLDKTSIVIINWTIGVYSIDDKMFARNNLVEDYKYEERDTVVSNAIWETE